MHLEESNKQSFDSKNSFLRMKNLKLQKEITVISQLTKDSQAVEKEIMTRAQAENNHAKLMKSTLVMNFIRL